jgi:hypothetical protein
MATNRRTALERAVHDHDRRIEERLGGLPMTIQLYRTIKALTELLAVGLCVYAAANGVATELALLGALFVVGGVEGIETLVAARGKASRVAEGRPGDPPSERSNREES